MNERDFCFWLHGFFELTGNKTLTDAQVEDIKNHLDLVFNKVTKNIAKNRNTIVGNFQNQEIQPINGTFVYNPLAGTHGPVIICNQRLVHEGDPQYRELIRYRGISC